MLTAANEEVIAIVLVLVRDTVVGAGDEVAGVGGRVGATVGMGDT